MSMHDINTEKRLDLREIEAESLERRLEFSGSAVRDLRPWVRAADVQVSLVLLLGSPAMDFHFNFLGEFAAEVFDVNARASVDMRRILASEKPYAHRFFPPTHRNYHDGKSHSVFAFCSPMMNVWRN